MEINDIERILEIKKDGDNKRQLTERELKKQQLIKSLVGWRGKTEEDIKSLFGEAREYFELNKKQILRR